MSTGTPALIVSHGTPADNTPQPNGTEGVGIIAELAASIGPLSTLLDRTRAIREWVTRHGLLFRETGELLRRAVEAQCLATNDALEQARTSHQAQAEAANEVAVLTTCRDHWKTSFEHERANVIRLRRLVRELHLVAPIKTNPLSRECMCQDCQLVREHMDPRAPETPLGFAT